MANTDNPYVGLRPYGPDDAHRFFGRTSETWELASWLLSSRLVIVYGAPGVGKTSLIQAGLLAALHPDRAQVLPVWRTPNVSVLLTASDTDHNPLTLQLLSTYAPEATSDSLRKQTVSQFLRGVSIRHDRYGDVLPLIAIIDQFELAFVDDPVWTRHRNDLLDQLVDAMEDVSHLQLLLAMRGDVLSEILPYEASLSHGNRKRHLVRPLDVEGAIEAVTGPPRSTVRSFAHGVAEELVDQLRTITFTNDDGEQSTVVAPTVEPMNLQVVCSSLWEGLPDDVTLITSEHLRNYGDVAATLTSFCVQAVIEVAAAEGIDVYQIWRWLEESFITELGTRGAVYQGLAWTGGMPNAVAQAFERRRILRSEERSGSIWYELVHDSLVEAIRRGRRLSEGLVEVAGPDARADDYLVMAESAVRSGMLPLAEVYAEAAVQASKRDERTLAEATSFLGELTFEHGRSETGTRAEQLYMTTENNFRRAAALFEAQQNVQAVGRVLASLGRLHMDRGRFVDAIRDLRSALERLPQDLAVRLDFARALHGSGQAQAAMAEYSRVLGSVSADDRQTRIEALVERGLICADKGDPVSALRDLDDAVRLRPELAGREDVVSARARAHQRMERA